MKYIGTRTSSQNTKSMIPPTRSAAPLNAMARALAACSAVLGVMATATAPAAGRKTASVTADCSQPLTAPRAPSLACSEPRDHDGQDRDADEQEDGVALDVAGLHVPQETPQDRGAHAHAVHGAVDHAMVERVDGRGDRILDRPDHAAQV